MPDVPFERLDALDIGTATQAFIFPKVGVPFTRMSFDTTRSREVMEMEGAVEPTRRALALLCTGVVKGSNPFIEIHAHLPLIRSCLRAGPLWAPASAIIGARLIVGSAWF